MLDKLSAKPYKGATPEDIIEVMRKFETNYIRRIVPDCALEDKEYLTGKIDRERSDGDRRVKRNSYNS